MTQEVTDNYSFLASLVTPASSPVIVTGTSRGGTSLISAICRSLGVNMGGRGENHEDPDFLRCFYPWDARMFADTYAARAKTEENWGFKVPMLAQHLNEVSLVAPSATYVFVYRNPVSAAFGEQKRGGEFDISLHWSIQFYSTMTAFFTRRRGTANFFLCSYERVAANPIPVAEALAQHLRLDFGLNVQESVRKSCSGDSGGYVQLVGV